jgi:radical SAM protein with 4Fe4S-binding SPASM domain
MKISSNGKSVRPFFWPPSLLLRQLGSVLLMGYLNNWKQLPRWLIRNALKSIPVSNGALGMGCIGYPGHPVWEVTASCNLNCIHCHAMGATTSPDELTTDEGRRLIDQIAQVDTFRTLVFTGGEPLLRPDIFELLKHAKAAGLANIIATNGILIDDEMAARLKENGVVCNAISLDAPEARVHDSIRQKPRAFELAVRGMEATKKAGIMLQINTTAMEYNMPYLSDLMDYVDQADVGIMLMYQLVAVGKGEKIEKATLKKNANQALSELISRKQRSMKTIVEPVAGPQYWPYLLEKKGIIDGPGFRFAEQVFHGCAAGRGFVYIKANGDVWPCPFVETNAGNVRETSFRQIYEKSPVFENLRNREKMLKGSCGECRYRRLCGGCRGRALAYSGDYLAEDPRCFIVNSGRGARATAGSIT